MTSEEADNLKIGDLVVWDNFLSNKYRGMFPNGTLYKVIKPLDRNWLICEFINDTIDSIGRVRKAGEECEMLDAGFMEHIKLYIKPPEPSKPMKSRFQLILED